jgi:hypothetical protein
VADVHEIETAVGEDDPFPVGARPLEDRGQLRDGQDFLSHAASYPFECQDEKGEDDGSAGHCFL